MMIAVLAHRIAAGDCSAVATAAARHRDLRAGSCPPQTASGDRVVHGQRPRALDALRLRRGAREHGGLCPHAA